MLLTLIFVKMCIQTTCFIVFITPEILELPAWKKVLSSKVFSDRLSVVAVDEAHCIAEWSVRTTVNMCVYNVIYIMSDIVVWLGVCNREVISNRGKDFRTSFEKII